MARSHKIYIVVDEDEKINEVVAAFTVKHEMITWLNEQDPEELKWLSVYASADGIYQEHGCDRLGDAKQVIE